MFYRYSTKTTGLAKGRLAHPREISTSPWVCAEVSMGLLRRAAGVWLWERPDRPDLRSGSRLRGQWVPQPAPDEA